jgi:hypothetical protein
VNAYVASSHLGGDKKSASQVRPRRLKQATPRHPLYLLVIKPPSLCLSPDRRPTNGASSRPGRHPRSLRRLRQIAPCKPVRQPVKVWSERVLRPEHHRAGQPQNLLSPCRTRSRILIRRNDPIEPLHPLAIHPPSRPPRLACQAMHRAPGLTHQRQNLLLMLDRASLRLSTRVFCQDSPLRGMTSTEPALRPLANQRRRLPLLLRQRHPLWSLRPQPANSKPLTRRACFWSVCEPRQRRSFGIFLMARLASGNSRRFIRTISVS